MTIDYKGSAAQPNAPAVAGDCGNLVRSYYGAYEAAALAQNKTVALTRVPKGSEVHGILYAHDALGANNGLTFGIEDEDGGTVHTDPALFKTVADASSAGAGVAHVMPFVTTVHTFLTVTKTGAGTATGTIDARAEYIFRGSD